MARKMKYSEVKNQITVRGLWPEILQTLCNSEYLHEAIDLWRDGNYRKKTYCPVHGGQSGEAFRLFEDFNVTGGGICNSRCNLSNGFSVLQEVNGWDFATALEEVRKYLTDNHYEPSVPIREIDKAPKPKPAKQKGMELKRLKTLWDEAYAFTDPKTAPWHRYLEKRGISLTSMPPTLRMHLQMSCYSNDGEFEGKYPTIIAPVMDIDGKIVGLHRTFITEDGNKADVSLAKKAVSTKGRSMSGGAIRLGESGPILSTCEGVETGLAAMEASGLPVWPACNAGMLRSMVIPDVVEHLVIWADRDVNGAGHTAAEALKLRTEAAGKKVSIFYPNLPMSGRKGVDWNDVLKEKGVWAFPTIQLPNQPLHAVR